MKPKTRYEREVVRLSRALPELSGKWKCRAQGMIDYNQAVRLRGRMTHVVTFVVVTTRGNWQVIRHYYMYAIFRYRKLERVEYLECMQHWLRDGHYVFMALNRLMGWCNDMWCHNQPMSIKKSYNHCSALSDPRDIGYDAAYYERVQKRFSYLPRDNERLRVDEMYRAVNTSPFYETVIQRDPGTFNRMVARGFTKSRELTAAARVAWRHGYDKLPAEWFDLVEMLQFIRRDLHNPKYVAPADLYAMHDEVQAIAERKRERERRERMERDRIRLEQLRLQREQMEAERAKEKAERDKMLIARYPKVRKKFFGLLIAGKGIEIRVLQSVEEFMQEGAAMHHCVYANGYYDVDKYPNRLIMSARRNGHRLETIEVDLKEYEVVQSRAKYNGESRYHDTILKLVGDNMDRIREINKRRRAI